MYFTKEEIVSKITQISHQRHIYDTDLSKLQLMLNTHKKYQIIELRKQFQLSITNLQKIARQNQSVLDLLKYRCQKLTKQSVQVSNQIINIEALKEYFMQFKQKINKQHTRGEQIICGRQKWQIMQGANRNSQNDEQQSLLGGHKAVKQTKQMALNVYQNITEQGSRIQQARVKMGNVLKNINFAGNIAQMLKTRTSEDNRLIVRLTIVLFIEIILCLFVVKPWWRGQ